MSQEHYGLCPFATAQRVLSGKWSIYILYLLSEGPVRFNELRRRMPEEMTHATLSRQLKKLEEEGIVLRVEFNQIPPRVEYSLSEVGKGFMPVLSALHHWGNSYIEMLKTKNE